MIIWTLVISLSGDGADARAPIKQFPVAEQCEVAGKEWQKALDKLVIGTKVEYTIACVQQDFVLVATGRDPMKI